MHCMTIPDQLMTRVPSMNQVTLVTSHMENETRSLQILNTKHQRIVIHQAVK